MERTTYYIIVAWREGESTIMSLSKNRFHSMRQNMIDDGFDNLQTEWYQKGKAQLPDLLLVFVYWEDPDTAPEYQQIHKWGSESVKLKVQE